MLNTNAQHVSPAKRIFSATFYGMASFFIMIVNKSILTYYKFPSAQFLGIGQMVFAVIILHTGKVIGVVSFPSLTSQVPKQIFPMPLIYFGNLVSGLGGTKQISLPMFTVLRRFTILFTMLLEICILSQFPSKPIVTSVIVMIGGSVIAASDDLAFDFLGYIYVFFNDICTASNNVYTKKKLNANDLGKYGIIFYNCLFMILPALFLVYLTGDLEKSINYDKWDDPLFLVQFFMSCIMGFVLLFATTLCTHFNSALTTTVVGCIKNVAITYVGMLFGGDYIFSVTNFIGITISIVGGLVYSYITFLDKQGGVRTKSEVHPV